MFVNHSSPQKADSPPEKSGALCSPRNAIPTPLNLEQLGKPPSPPKSITRRTSIILSPTVNRSNNGVRMAFYRGRLERVKAIEHTILQLQRENPKNEDKIAAEKAALAQATAELKQSLNDFISDVDEFGKIIDEDPQTAVEIIQSADTYVKEWCQEAAKVLFNKCTEQTLSKLIAAYIVQEVTKATEPHTLFRETAGTLGHLMGLYQNKYLHQLLEDRLDKIINSFVLHRKVGTIGRKEPGRGVTYINQKKAKDQTHDIFRKLGKYLKSPLPQPLSSMYHIVYDSVEKKFPTVGLSRIVSLFFLQAVNPALISGTKRFDLGEIEFTDPKDQANAIVLSKVLQSVVNGLCPPGELYADIKEEFIRKERAEVEKIAHLLLGKKLV